LSFTASKVAQEMIKVFCRLTAFWLKYFDYLLINKVSAYDAASSYYFMGRKSDRALSDKELLGLYRGANEP
jgi:hypothetical protein